MVSSSMEKLGRHRSVIREIFEYGKQRAAVVGEENIYDFSLGNPSIPAPRCVDDAIKNLLLTCDSVDLHGYTSAAGDMETKKTIKNTRAYP